MQLRFGNLSFNVNGCDVRTQVQAVLRAGRPVRYVRRMFVSGELEGDTQASLSTQESVLRAFLEDADPRTTMRYDRGRQSLDRHATYIVATFIAGAAR